ncbi:MAG: hypothetical protein EAZ08_13095 [Cytophagales bacterium]|nr:MAG: hypothetical protein EAZ08_13095 [Cytophagales bacterium]
MEVTLEKNAEVLEAYVTVKVNESDYQEKYDKKLKEYAKKAFVKGFRQGKVPPMVIKKLYGKAIKVEEINQIASDSLYNYLRDGNIQIFGSPMIAIEKMAKIDWDNHSEFEFVYEIGLQPDISFQFDSNFAITEYEVQIDDTDLKNYTTNLLERFADYAEKEEADLASDVWGRFIPTSEEVLHMGDKEFTKGKEFFGIIDLDAISEANQSLFLGKKVGDVVTFDLRTVFPTDEELSSFVRYSEEEVKDIKGEVVYTINSISTRTMPELNQDTFNKVFGENTGINSLEEFNAKVTQVLQQRYAISARLETLLSFVQQLTEKAELTLPNAFLRRWLVTQNENKNIDDESYENFLKGLHTQLVIDKLSQQNEISVNEEELRNYTKEVQILNLFSMGFLTGITNETVLDLFVNRYFEDEKNEQTLMNFERNIKASKLLDINKDKITVEKIVLSGKEFDLKIK